MSIEALIGIGFWIVIGWTIWVGFQHSKAERNYEEAKELFSHRTKAANQDQVVLDYYLNVRRRGE